MHYELENRGILVRFLGWARDFSSKRPDKFWGPPDHVFKGYRGRFHRGWSGCGVKLTTHERVVTIKGMSEAIPPLSSTPHCVHSFMMDSSTYCPGYQMDEMDSTCDTWGTGEGYTVLVGSFREKTIWKT